MKRVQINRFWRVGTECLFGSILVALKTYV